jgi:hypothetical protein
VQQRLHGRVNPVAQPLNQREALLHTTGDCHRIGPGRAPTPAHTLKQALSRAAPRGAWQRSHKSISGSTTAGSPA